MRCRKAFETNFDSRFIDRDRFSVLYGEAVSILRISIAYALAALDALAT